MSRGEDGGADKAAVPASRSFVGRLDEVRRLDRLITSARDGRGGLAFIAGDAGIGKSLLAAQVASLAAAEGMFVATGHCRHEEGAPSYWPWSQLLRDCAEILNSELHGISARGLDLLGRIAPELTGGEIFEGIGGSVDTGARYELMHAVATVLRQVAETRPLVVVIEDFHGADEASAHLLSSVARDIVGQAIALLVTYRDRELEAIPGEVVTRLVGEAETVHLAGLGPEEIQTLIMGESDGPVHPTVVEAIVTLSGGNPLFAREVTRLLSAQGLLAHPVVPGQPLELPTELREIIRRRTAPLSEPVAEMVGAAAVLGRDFDFALLRHVIDAAPEYLIELLSDAVRDEILAEQPGRPGRYRFHHALVREAVYADLDQPARVELHRRVARALQDMHADDLGPWLSEIAHHLHAAIPVVEPREAADAARRAGDRAMSLSAFDEAILHLERAIRVLEAFGELRPELRCDLLLALGDARRRAGRADHREVLREAVDLARVSGDATRLAAAALMMPSGIGTLGMRPREDTEAIAYLEEAYRHASDMDRDLGTLVKSALALARYWVGPDSGADQLSQEALIEARRGDDPQVLGRALAARYFAIWHPATVDERIGLASEMVDLGERFDDSELEFVGRSARLTALLTRGDIVGVDRELVAVERGFDEVANPLARWSVMRWRAMRALMEGRLDEAEVLVHQAAEVGEATQDPEMVMQYFGTQLWVLHRERYELGPMEPLVRQQVADNPNVDTYRALLGYLFTESDRLDEARATVEPLLGSDGKGVDHLWPPLTWLTTTSLLADVASALGEVEWCAQIHDALAPYRHLCVVVGTGTVYAGTVAQWAGRAAWGAGRFQDAASLYEEAIALNRRVGAGPLLAHALRQHACLLMDPEAGLDPSRAPRLFEEARTVYERCHMERAVEHLDTIRQEFDPGGSGAATHQARALLARDGDGWKIGWNGQETRLGGLKGLSYLDRLVADPRREVHVLDLASPGGSTERPAVDRDEVQRAGSDTGPMLDRRAKQAYRRRLEDLADELREAEEFNDTERATRAREEIDVLTEQLAAAVGLGGRDRTTGSDAERARVSVTKALRTAIIKVTDHVPALGRHLEASVKTGVFCSYDPDPASRVEWDTVDSS